MKMLMNLRGTAHPNLIPTPIFKGFVCKTKSVDCPSNCIILRNEKIVRNTLKMIQRQYMPKSKLKHQK